MSELSEQRWAVISERGSEAQGLKHADAAALVRSLKGEDLSGLCVVTDDAAGRLQPSAQASPNGTKPPAKKPTRERRAAKK
jgi:hypothetical protein